MNEIDDFLQELDSEANSNRAQILDNAAVERLLETPGSAVATTSNSNNITAEPSSNIIRQTTIEEPLASKTADNSADKAIDSSTGRLVDNSVLKEESQDEIFLPASTTDETLAQLIGMGYDLDAAQLALQQSAGNSLDEAIAFLFNQQKLVEGKPLSPASAVSSRPLLPPRSSPPPLPRRPSGSDQDGFPDLELDLEEAKRKLDSAVHSAGQFLQRVKTGIVTAVESIDSPSDREHTLGSSVLSEPSSPVSQFSVPDPLVTSPSQALPDKRFTIQEFRVSMKSGPQYSPKDLLKLYLRDCGKRQVEPISALIEQMERADVKKEPMAVIVLNGVQFTKRQCEALSDLLVLCTQLKVLRLLNTNVDDYMLKLILKGVLLIDCLSRLNLSQSRLVSSKGLKYLSVFIQKSTSLTHLDLSGIKFDFASISFFSHAFRVKTSTLVLNPGHQHRPSADKFITLHTLRLDYCDISLEFLEELVAGLLESNIRVLGLRGNHFGTDGAALIAELLGQMERLDIGQNNLRTPGLEVICSALITNDTLAYLDVQDNEIDEMGLKIVANTLLQNSRLEVINISRNINCCSRRSVEALKAALAVNRSLKALILEHVGLVSETAVILGESLSRNSSLEALIITGNDAALNPLRTDLLNFEQNVKAYGQKAFRSVAQGLNKAFQSIQQTFDDPVGVRREAQAPPMTKSLPTAVELTRSAVIAFVTSMRVNHTLTSLKILVPDDSIALNRVAPGSKLYEFRQLFGELNDLIKRNQESKPAPNESNPLGERPSDAFALE